MSHKIETTSGVDVSEKGRNEGGEATSLDRRLFMQLLAFGDCVDTAALTSALTDAGIAGALYSDLNDPRGVALVTYNEDPDFFVSQLRQFLLESSFAQLTPKPEYTMFGRTYALGHENDLEEALFDRPRGRILDPSLQWAIWYPLRRSGSFEQLAPQEQKTVLMEHGGVGHAFGKAGHGFDVRLACHGLDKNDNDFIIGLIGPQLHPLSVIVQRMRKTKQTSLHLERLGPFFVGKVIWQAASDE